MATNPIPNGLDDLFALAEDAADGAHTHEVDDRNVVVIQQTTPLSPSVFRAWKLLRCRRSRLEMALLFTSTTYHTAVIPAKNMWAVPLSRPAEMSSQSK